MHVYNLKQFAREDEKVCVHCSVWKQGMLPLHGHEFFEIFYVTSGSCKHILNGKETVLHRGDLVFLNYYSEHTIEPLSDDLMWENINFYSEFLDKDLISHNNAQDFLKLSVFKNLFAVNTQAADIILRDVSEYFEGLFRDIDKEYSEGKVGYLENVKYFLLIILSRIFRLTFEEKKEHTAGEEGLEHGDLLRLVLKEIQGHLGENISLKMIAQKAYVSPKYFSSLFKSKVGVNFKEFINEQRIKKACELLDETDTPITNIMQFVGFSDHKYFYLKFKAHTGMTPREYRNRRR